MTINKNIPRSDYEISETFHRWLNGESYENLDRRFHREFGASKALIYRIRNNRSAYDANKGEGRVYDLTYYNDNQIGKPINKRMELYIRDQLRAKIKITMRGIAYNIGHSLREVKDFIEKHPYLIIKKYTKDKLL